MHGRMYPNLCHVTVLFAHDPLSSSAYPMITNTYHVASNLPIKTLVARQLLVYRARPILSTCSTRRRKGLAKVTLGMQLI